MAVPDGPSGCSGAQRDEIRTEDVRRRPGASAVSRGRCCAGKPGWQGCRPCSLHAAEAVPSFVRGPAWSLVAGVPEVVVTPDEPVDRHPSGDVAEPGDERHEDESQSEDHHQVAHLCVGVVAGTGEGEERGGEGGHLAVGAWLHAPQVDGVGEVAQRRDVPPGVPTDGKRAPDARTTMKAAAVRTPKMRLQEAT